MRLADLNPVLKGTLERGYLRFDCPHPGHTHSVVVHVHSGAPGEIDRVKYWHAEGAFPDSLTLTPSIDLDTAARARKVNPGPCWHGFVTDGDVQ